MKTKQYSSAHLEAAKILFPEQSSKESWLEEQWNDDEINACKKLEMSELINSPTLENYPIKFPILSPSHDFKIADELLATHKDFRSFLSVGCGFGEKELMLAKRYPHVSFVAVDNAPYVEKLNLIAEEMILNNIVFKKMDIRDTDFGMFDVVFSFAVIYCIPDEFLGNYFTIIMNKLNPKGVALIGCSANYSLKLKIISLFRYIFNKNKKGSVKQIGWLRDIKHVKQYIPKELMRENLFKFDFSCGNKTSGKYSVRSIIETLLYPISNSSYLFVLKNLE
jgi:SAM-dependent methyltransferase